MTNCSRCGTRLLPGALACINCDLPIPPAVAPTPASQSASPYAAPPLPYGAPPTSPGPVPPPYAGPVPYAPGHYPQGPAPWTTNGLAIASLVLSILWIFGIGTVLGIIFGHVSRGQIKKRPQRGAGVALAGLIIGYVGLVATVVLYANISKIIHSNTVQNVVAQQDINDAASAERSYFKAAGSFTSSGIDLREHGFSPIGDDTIAVLADKKVGYCIVGGHRGHGTWYLYDSTSGGLLAATYTSEKLAADECTLPGNANEFTVVN